MEILHEIITKLKQHITIQENESINFSSTMYNAIPLSKNNFYPIIISDDNKKENKEENKEGNNGEHTNQNQQLCFVDGGNNELLGAPNFSLQLIRVAGVVVKNNKTIKIVKKEYFLLAKTLREESINNDNKKNNIYFTVELFPYSKGSSSVLPNKKELLFDSYDQTIITGTHRAEISRIAEVARKFSELLLAKEMMFFLDKNDIIVLDNQLKIKFTNEEKYFNELFKAGEEKNILITGLCKTTRMLTNSGNSAVAVLHTLASINDKNNNINNNNNSNNDNSSNNNNNLNNNNSSNNNNNLLDNGWYYYPSVKINASDHKAELFFVKLNKHSKYLFKFEVYNKQCNDHNKIKQIIHLLAENSRDYSFPGYPYGLIQADKEARVSEQEKEYFKMKLVVQAGKNSNDLERSVNAINAHDVLDSVH